MIDSRSFSVLNMRNTDCGFYSVAEITSLELKHVIFAYRHIFNNKIEFSGWDCHSGILFPIVSE
jgi:hypothetical protein